MAVDKKIRVMWLLNHTTLRKFELKQLSFLGINEVFTPKTFPYDEGNLYASVDYSTDFNLTIPGKDLEVLNNENWYENPSPKAWEIANKYFNIAFISFFPEQVKSVIRNFNGVIILRAFGLASGVSYTQLLKEWLSLGDFLKLQKIYNRFWFGAAYEHLRENEEGILYDRYCFLPVGLPPTEGQGSTWKGEIKKIFFICPGIATSPYYRSIYEFFKRNFSDFEYVIGGFQPIPVDDPSVIGFVPREVHEKNLRQLRVMFYHSTEPNHIHYHPFEAIEAGMPLVFMAGGMLDRLGGKKLPGRCKSVREARFKIKRILQDDWDLIEKIRRSQICLLEKFKPENCASSWREGFSRILESLQRINFFPARLISKKKPRIAVILPHGYRGGTLRGAKLLAKAIELGSIQAAEPVEVVFAHLDDPALYNPEDFTDLPATIHIRPFQWRVLNTLEARRAIAYAGIDVPLNDCLYQVPDDGIMQFYDCDLWVVVSDRLQYRLLPVRPYIMMIYDYLQRYVSFLPPELNQQFIAVAHAAEKIMVTTEFTRQDAIQYAGIPADRVVKVPMLVSTWKRDTDQVFFNKEQIENYFLWITNLGLYKNHANAFKALTMYYEKYGGQLKCYILGVDTDKLLHSDLPHLKFLSTLYAKSNVLKEMVEVLGELSDSAYRAYLAAAAFLWHPCLVDNETFSVVEAASLGVPSLSSDYPSMREINETFALNISWMNPHDPEQMARQLKKMEGIYKVLQEQLQEGKRVNVPSLESLATDYWRVIKECL